MVKKKKKNLSANAGDTRSGRSPDQVTQRLGRQDQVTQSQADPLEQEMAMCSRILA